MYTYMFIHIGYMYNYQMDAWLRVNTRFYSSGMLSSTPAYICVIWFSRIPLKGHLWPELKLNWAIKALFESWPCLCYSILRRLAILPSFLNHVALCLRQCHVQSMVKGMQPLNKATSLPRTLEQLLTLYVSPEMKTPSLMRSNISVPRLFILETFRCILTNNETRQHISCS